MKKTLSIVLSLILLFQVTSSTTRAFADEDSSSIISESSEIESSSDIESELELESSEVESFEESQSESSIDENSSDYITSAENSSNESSIETSSEEQESNSVSEESSEITEENEDELNEEVQEIDYTQPIFTFSADYTPFDPYTGRAPRYTPGDQVLVANYYMSGYFYNGLILEGHHFTGNVMVARILTDAGSPHAFCVEPHVYDPSTLTYSVNTDSINTWVGATTTQKTLVGYVLLASNDDIATELNNNPISNNSPSYIAAQSMIWEIMARPESQGPWIYIDPADPNFLEVRYTGQQVQAFVGNNGCQAQYALLKEKVRSMAILPSFMSNRSSTAPTIDITGNSITLTDTNNVIQHYNFISTADVTFSVSGNELTITKTSPSVDLNDVLFTVSNKYTASVLSGAQTQGVLYAFKSGSQAKAFGVGDPVNAFFKLRSSNQGQVRITKSDAETGALLAGAVYGIYDAGTNALVTSITTNNLGVGTSIKIPVGNYYVQEITPPTGYQSNATKYPVSVLKDVIVDVGVQDYIIKGKITLVKTNTAGNKQLTGAIYGIYKASDSSLVTTVTSHGTNAIESDLLPYEAQGYYLQEITAPDRYEVDPTKYYFMIDTHLEIKPHTVADDPIVGRMILNPVEQEPTRSIRPGISSVPHTGVESEEEK